MTYIPSINMMVFWFHIWSQVIPDNTIAYSAIINDQNIDNLVQSEAISYDMRAELITVTVSWFPIHNIT